MQVSLHKNARTTPAIRRELQASTEPTKVLARRYHLSPITVRKWRRRDSTEDASHRPNTLHANLSPAQEFLVVELRKLLLLPLDDLLVVTHEFINDTVSRSGLDRCLRRHGVSRLADLIYPSHLRFSLRSLAQPAESALSSSAWSITASQPRNSPICAPRIAGPATSARPTASRR